MSRDFHQRFDLEIGLEEAKRRFVNRVHNLIINQTYEILHRHNAPRAFEEHLRRHVVTSLGEIFELHRSLDGYIKGDFNKCLIALQAIYEFFSAVRNDIAADISEKIGSAIQQSEVDLEIKWQNGEFSRAGAELLDEELVNKSLHWLRGKKYQSVLQPFQKGIEHLFQSLEKPEFLADVIPDMYESLEALAKIITERPDRDFSANQELFLKKIKASPPYKKILKEYISHANEFRHAVEEGKQKPPLSQGEAESFIYLTGLFIRLAIIGQFPHPSPSKN